jgi:lysophospholipase L1-like esterase
MTLPAGLLMAAPLAPLLWWQGKRVRRITPILPEASGARTGRWVSGHASVQALSAGVHDRPLRVLVLGDSSAAGVGAAHQDEALSGQLGLHVRGQLGVCLPAVVEWTLLARTGLRTREAHGLLDDLGASRFDVAVVALGVNDVTALQRPASWVADVKQLVARLRGEQCVTRVLWSGLPPMHRFPALPQPLRAVLGRHARDLDAALKRHACRAQAGLQHVPMPPMSRPEWIARDGFHPGPQAYAVWGDAMAQAMTQSVLQWQPGRSAV